MIFHEWFGRHVADPAENHWDKGHFVSHCRLCGREMIKLPGLTWRLREARREPIN